MNGNNPPTAKGGIRSSSSHLPALEPQPEQEQSSALNPTASQTPVEPRDPSISTGFDDMLSLSPSDIVDGERLAAIIEALSAHRAILIGLRSRKESEMALNPASRELELGAIRRGILRCEVLLSELQPEA